MVGGEEEGGGEGYAELHLLARDSTVAARVWFGSGWMPPGCTELSSVKLAFTRLVVKVRLLVESREPNATSDGELTRVGTCGVENVGGPSVRPTSESFGNTR